MDIINNEGKLETIIGDMNVDLLKCKNHKKKQVITMTFFFNGFLLPADLANHFGAYLSTNIKIKHQITHTCTRQTRIFSDTNINLFHELLKNIDFSHITELRCPNIAFEEFISFEQVFPQKSIRTNKEITKREAWVTQDLLTSSQNKVKLLIQN